jgi:hypothetical protein
MSVNSGIIDSDSLWRRSYEYNKKLSGIHVCPASEYTGSMESQG